MSKKTLRETDVIPKIIEVSTSVLQESWMKHSPEPLVPGERVIVVDQTDVPKGYVRVKHGKENPKRVSILSLRYFCKL